MTDARYIFFNGILAAPNRISVVEGKTEVITVRKEDIKRITLDTGYQAERPIVQVVFGVIILGIALYPLLRFLSAPTGSSTMTTRAFMLLCLIPLGVWAIQSALKQGYFLNVELENDRRKLGFKTKCKKADLREFVRQVAILGYTVDTSNLLNPKSK
jgi:hypothetical protein